MTCEIAVMNKRGIALAADTAVTLGDGIKIYHHSEKLFPLRFAAPVAILTYGSAEIMGVPWEVVIRSYAQHLGDRHFDRLSEYAAEFLRFIEGSSVFFPEAAQRDWFRYTVGSYWKERLLDPLASKLKEGPKRSPRGAAAVLTKLIESDHAEWQKSPALENFAAADADRALAAYRPMLDELAKKLFGDHGLDNSMCEALERMARSMITRRWCHPADQSWIVFAGFGEVEPFPVLEIYQVGAVVAGKLRYVKEHEARIDLEDSAIVLPLAQSDMIDMFYRGIDPQLEEKLDGIVTRCVSHFLNRNGDKPAPALIEKASKGFRKALEEEIDGKYRRPLMAAVDALPRHDLAKMAETLVSLTAFRKRMSVDEKETVGGAIDVAVLSKGEGFVWVKRGGAAQG